MPIFQISPVNTNRTTYANLPCKKFSSVAIPYEQNGLSFAQAEALKGSRLLSKITFRGRIIAPSYDVKDVAIVQELLAKCHYGKRDLIYGDISQVRTKITDQGVGIEGFYTADDSPDGNIYGICEELAYKVGRRLQKAFGDKYLVFGIHGSNKEFPHGHIYLGMIKNIPENQELISRQTKNYDQMNQLYREFQSSEVYKQFHSKLHNPEEAGKLIGTELYLKYLDSAETVNHNLQMLSSSLDKDSLRNSLIIDPSFRKMQELGVGDLFVDYKCHSVRSLEQVNAIPSTPCIVGQGIPLGDLGDLIPEFTNSGNRLSPLGLYANNRIIPFGFDFSKLPESHPFFRFMVQLNEAFIKSE